ncbi:kinase-like domain-containing protein [Morchella snyderi]|nr:kinase-like domain-containing protein [Morchella snyderi]
MDNNNYSNNTSAATSRHTSTASIWSLHNHITGHSRNPTPPTPVSSPSLYTPPPPENPRKYENGPHLHPIQSQYRQQTTEHAPAVKETHVLGLDFDPISGRKIINHYTIIDEIGRGVHGKVKLGTDIETGELVAIKIVERMQGRPRLGRRGDGESEKKVRREIAILKKCRHENVVRLLEVIDDPQSKKVYLILEYVQRGEIIWRKEGDPDRYIPALTIEQSRSTFRDTVLGLEYLHYHGIIHRDIKPANLLWTKDHRVKISDFGVSFLGRPIRDDDDGESTGADEEPTGLEQNDIELAKTAGTPAFFAPELCHIDPTGPRQITSAIDVWALGVTLYCLLFARCPFMADNEFQLLQVIAKEELMIPNRQLLEMETEPVDEDLKDLLKRLLIKDPAKRITLKEVKRHPWVLHGITDPCAWVDDTDPERISDGNRIEVTVEDVEKAVSSAGVLHRARSAMKRAGAWYRGLRKRASSTADTTSNTSFKDSKDKRSDRKWDPEDAQQHLQGYYAWKDDEEKELQWMGGAPAWNEERRPSMTTFGSTDTVQPPVSHDNNSKDTPSPNAKTSPGYEGRKLRRRPSINLLATPRRHAHSESGSGHRSPSTSSTSRFSDVKGENAPAVASPQHGSGGLFRDVKRIVGRMRSGGLSSENGDKFKDPISREGSPLRARDALAGHLRGDHSFYAYAHHSLQVQIPQYRRHSYTCEQIEATVPLDSSPRFSPGGSRMSRAEEVRRKLSSLVVDEDQPCPPSPDDNVSMESIWRRDQQKRMLRVEERERYSQPSSAVAPGWTRENYYYPTTDSPTPPIAIDGKIRGSFFDDNVAPSVLPHRGNPENHLVSSSSEEQFATTAGSSLTNSTSFPSVPSVLSESSSISSDYYSRYSRKNSIAGLMEEEPMSGNGIYEYLRRERPGTPYRENFNNFQNFDIDEEVDEAVHEDDDGGDEGEDSDGGFVLPPRRAIKPRSESVTVAELSRKPIDRPAETPPRTRRRSRSSSGTVKEKSSKSDQRGRTKEKTVTE